MRTARHTAKLEAALGISLGSGLAVEHHLDAAQARIGIALFSGFQRVVKHHTGNRSGELAEGKALEPMTEREMPERILSRQRVTPAAFQQRVAKLPFHARRDFSGIGQTVTVGVRPSSTTAISSAGYIETHRWRPPGASTPA